MLKSPSLGENSLLQIASLNAYNRRVRNQFKMDNPQSMYIQGAKKLVLECKKPNRRGAKNQPFRGRKSQTYNIGQEYNLKIWETRVEGEKTLEKQSQSVMYKKGRMEGWMNDLWHASSKDAKGRSISGFKALSASWRASSASIGTLIPPPSTPPPLLLLLLLLLLIIHYIHIYIPYICIWKGK